MHGTLEHRDDGRWQLRFTRSLPHPPGKVWRAITEPEHLAHWFPTTIDGDRRPGASLRFSFPNDEAPPFDGEMLAVEPERVLEFRWGPDTLRIELEPDGDGTRLRLLDVVEDRGKSARDAAGWHVCLDSLERHLDGAQDARDAMSAWSAVHPHYVEEFGPEAATIGPPEGMA